jgi:uncharacterized protein YutE (UPF0331/DUF86 family)
VTDAALLAKRLAQIETSVTELRTMARVEAIPHDVREQPFVEHTLQIAIQAALDARISRGVGSPPRRAAHQSRTVRFTRT